MTLDQIENFVSDSLTTDVSGTSTTFPVNNADIFPDPTEGEYNLVVWDVESHTRPDQDPDVEVVRVTARDVTNNELTVTRGQENTAASSHPKEGALHLSYTQKLVADIESAYVAEGEDFDGKGNSEFTNLAAVSVGGTEYVGTYQTEGDLPDPTQFDVGAEVTVVSDPNGETSVYKLVDE